MSEKDNNESAGNEEQTQVSDKGYCSVYTKLMENYRLSDPIDIGEQIHSVHKEEKGDEFYCLRSDGYVEGFFPDKNSSTGFISEKTELHGAHIAVACDASGCTLVFATQAEELYYIKETEKGSSKFSEPKKVNVMLPYNARNSKGVFVKLIGGNVWISILVQAGADVDNMDTYVLSGMWKEDKTIINNSGYTVTAEKCVWSASDERDPVVLVSGTRVIGIHAISGEIVKYPSLPFSTLCDSIDCVYDSSKNCEIIAVTSRNDLYALVCSEGNSWVKMNQDINVKNVKLYIEASFDIHVFCISDKKHVLHGYIDFGEKGIFKTMAPLISDCSEFSIPDSNISMPSVFCYNKDRKIVDYLILQQECRNWNIQTITIPSDNNVYQYASYMTEVTTYDK